MSTKPPLMELPIETSDTGFYSGFSKSVAIYSKLIVAILVIWAVVFPEQAGRILNAINSFILANTAYWYIWIVALFVTLCIALAIWPAAGRLKLGVDADTPEFSNFSWFSMMFGAGIGVGMLTWAVAEPVYHFQNNPEVIQGIVEGSSAENVRYAYKWSFLHWGLGAWACYAIAGLALGFFCYRRGLPLTMRSSLTPLFGKTLSGPLGNLIDIVAVVATILGVAQTLGFGVEQFVAGLTRIGIDGLMNDGGTANTTGIIVALLAIMGASTASALSGVGKGIKWLSNLNMGLSIFLLSFFLIFGSTFFGLQALFLGIWDYVIALPSLMFTVWRADGVEGSVATNLEGWQGAWSVFYWAWWVAFAPFVGLFLARISKGRTIREFVLGAMIVPSLMCFVWFTWAGGTAIDLTLNQGAGDAIFGTGDGDKIFAMVVHMLGATLGWVMSLVIVILLMTYLVTTADSAVLIVNTINAAGDEGPKARPHIYFWGIALGAVVGALLIAGGGGGGGLKAIQTAMVIGAFPFSVVMVLQCVALVKAISNDIKREKSGIQTTTEAAPSAAE
ncbi:Glycine betaine-Na(+) symporter [Tritonibacter multivorans]|uniref:Glycine betaine-Na(+) symporter n=1 Tax=Tritonibacter multivorans TaxID=928856 RepID=A0A0P1GY27_9RHOB|nr:BCCT family transporter [Tritonibacter multivorans]MDA7421967.1 BCCT family transporter [Tritonibacter multivorans]CUH78762.1 Glycine betaine-Na(+) symporter [Tritonibacter multivorans]SFD68608.1 choline/carnitine/betaine transport [Tritonibacter multivorans]